MGLRFRRSVRLFPGVRLNFSRSGVSTTVGRRGATMTFGAQGTYLNVGLPGTGLSYRTRVSPAERHRQSAPRPDLDTPALPHGNDGRPDQANERLIHSAPVDVLTSLGLGDLKALINEAAVRYAELTSEVEVRKAALEIKQRRLKRSQAFIARLALGKSAPQRAREVQTAETELLTTEAELEGCHVEIDFGLDPQTQATFEALVQAFRELSTCERIWDITATSAIPDRVAARTLASTTVRRTRVAFDVTAAELIRCADPALKLGNVGGRDLQIYPAFIMMRDANGDFALIEYPDLETRYKDSPFLEQEHVPGDARIIGQTWHKANKDGSRDLRFNDNYSIPIVQYAELHLRSDAGVFEVYQLSDAAKAQSFIQAFDAHRRALAALVSRDEVIPAAVDDEPPRPDPASEEAAAMARVRPLSNLWLDWATLAAAASVLVFGGAWIEHAHSVPPPEPPLPAVAPQKPAVAPTRHHRRRAHHRTVKPATVSPTPGASDSVSYPNAIG